MVQLVSIQGSKGDYFNSLIVLIVSWSEQHHVSLSATRRGSDSVQVCFHTTQQPQQGFPMISSCGILLSMMFMEMTKFKHGKVLVMLRFVQKTWRPSRKRMSIKKLCSLTYLNKIYERTK